MLKFASADGKWVVYFGAPDPDPPVGFLPFYTNGVWLVYKVDPDA